MIGLVDYDWQLSNATSILIPNLEIMKLATYYHTEEQKFCRLISLNETELDGYEKIYFFSEHTNQNVPQAFLANKNVVFGGTAFTNQTYIPFKNPLIDFTLPRSTIYKEFLQEKYTEGIDPHVIEHVLDDSYYRMRANDEILPIPPIQLRKRVFIFDRDIFYPNWTDVIDHISQRNPSNIICIHPIFCKNLTQYFTLRNYEKISRASNNIVLNLNIPPEEFYYLFKEYTNLFLADIATTSSVYLAFGGTHNSRHQYGQELVYKLNLLYSFWSRKIPIKLWFIEPELGRQNPFINLFKLIAMWSNVMCSSETAQAKTLISRVRANKGKKIENQEYEELLKFAPAAKQLIDYSYTQIVQGGIWRL